MRVLIITNNCVKESGGWGRYSSEVIEHLKKRNIDVGVFEINNLNFGLFLSARKAARHCDVVHAMDIWPYALYAYFAVLGTNKKLILSGVGTYSVAPMRKFLQRTLLKIIFKRVLKVVCISDYTRDQIRSYIPNAPVETVLMGLTKLPSVTIEKSSRYPLILTVGAVKERKGQLDTFRAVLLLKEKYPNILYVTIGDLSDAKYVSEIRKIGNEKYIQMLSDITDVGLSEWYARADVFCLNANNKKNHFEGFGLAILEAGQFGVPSVGSANCGIESAIEDGVSGYLSQQGDTQDIARKIEEALTLKRSKVINFIHKFDWDNTVDTYVAYYQSMY